MSCKPVMCCPKCGASGVVKKQEGCYVTLECSDSNCFVTWKTVVLLPKEVLKCAS